MHQILCYFLSFFCLSQLSSIGANGDDYKVTIIHVNDLYSAFSGVKHDNSLCDLNDDLKQCIGGAPKIVAKVHELRTKEFVVFINAGNNLGGFWYNQFGPKVVTDFFSQLEFDVIALGFSDFELSQDSTQSAEEGLQNITQFLSVAPLTSRIVSCNIQANDKYISNFYQSVRKYAIINQNHPHRIGIIGFAKSNDSLVESSAFAYLKGAIKDPIKCLQEESEHLKRSGHNIIFAVGSGDQTLFRDIIEKVPNIDLVIGSYGFTKDLSLLKERSSDSYPDFISKGSTGERIIVTSDVFGKSVGKLSLIFDSNGNIKSSEGTLIKTDEEIEDSDDKTKRLANDYQKALYIGKTKVYLNGDDCSTRECNLGNLISDSLIFYHNNHIKRSFNSSLIKLRGNDVLKERAEQHRDVIALINSKNILNSIGNVNTLTTDYSDNTPEYIISKISLDKVFDRRQPKIQFVITTGKTIRHLLEDYFQRSDLFQVSALRVRYDRRHPINHSIIEISVKRCTNNCFNDTYYQLNDTNLYEVLLPQTVDINQYNDSLQVITDLNIFDILKEYIFTNSPINTTIENRITIIGGKSDAFGAKTEILMTLFSTLIAVCHLRYYN